MPSPTHNQIANDTIKARRRLHGGIGQYHESRGNLVACRRRLSSGHWRKICRIAATAAQLFLEGIARLPQHKRKPSPGFSIMIAPRTINPEHEPTEDQRDAVVHNGFMASYRGSRSPRNDANDLAGGAVSVETVRQR